MTIVPLSKSQKASLERATATYQDQLDDHGLAYLESRGLGSSHVIETHRLGVVRSPLPGHEAYTGRLVIPYVGPTGNIYDVRFRCLAGHDCKEAGCPKILGLPGAQLRMYNTQALASSEDTIYLAEGEPDTMTWTACGVPSVGIPGIEAWHPHHSRMLAGFSKVVLLAHGDDAGRKLASKVGRALPSTCHVMVAPTGDDVNSLYLKRGREGLLAFVNERDEDGL